MRSDNGIAKGTATAASAHAVRSERSRDERSRNDTPTPRMMPGQTPYTEEELARLYEMVHWAAQYIEDHPEWEETGDNDPEALDTEQYTVYNKDSGERRRE